MYIGKTNGNNPKYFGSGKLIKLAIKKYGADKFTKRILFESDSEDKLREKELEYIALFNAVDSDQYYNLHEGGQGGDTVKFRTTNMSEVVTKYWDSLSEKERHERCRNIGRYDKSGSNNPRARRAIANGKEYACLKDILKDYPEVSYSSLKTIAREERFPNKYNLNVKYL